MKIVLNQISNPGISFTEDVNNKIILLYDLTQKNSKKICSYQEFQDYLISNNVFTGSYIRSFIPFLFSSGIINRYDQNIIFSEFFTSLGSTYVNTINNIKFADDNLQKDLINIKSDLLELSLNYRIENKKKFYEKYLDILKFFLIYKKINREEFYIYEYSIQQGIDCENLIAQYRTMPNSIDIYVKGDNDLEMSFRSNNAYNYLMAFLSQDQCNYLTKTDQSYYIITKSKYDLVAKLIQENGGKNE